MTEAARARSPFHQRRVLEQAGQRAGLGVQIGVGFSLCDLGGSSSGDIVETLRVDTPRRRKCRRRRSMPRDGTELVFLPRTADAQ